MAANFARISLILVIFASFSLASDSTDPVQHLKNVLMSRFSDQDNLVSKILKPVVAAAKSEEDLKRVQEMADQLEDLSKATKWEEGLYRDEADSKNLFTMIKERSRGHEDVIRAALRPLMALIPDGDKYLNNLMYELQDQTWSQHPACGTCTLSMFVLRILSYVISWSSLRDYLNLICRVLLPDIVPEWHRADLICPGSIDAQGPLLYSILRGEFAGGLPIPLPIDIPITLNPTPGALCEYLNSCWPDEETDIANYFSNHKASFPSLKPQISMGEPDKKEKVVQKSSVKEVPQNAIKVVQMADVHIEPEYSAGTLTPCGLPVCCHIAHGPGTAGQWGDHFCNLPRKTADHMFSYINSQHDVDFVIYSGDNAPHSVWVETRDSQLHSTEEVVESIKQNFPGKYAYATIGNHEMYPTNVYSMDHMEDTRVLNARFTELFADIGGFEEQQIETMAQGGFYTKLVRPGLRILTYNTNYMYTFNWINIHNDQGTILPPQAGERTRMTNWMVATMDAARNDNEKVILSGHHPPGRSDYLVSQSRWLIDFVLDYHDLIVLHITGHTHRDDFKLISDPVTGEAKSVINIMPTMNGYNVANPTIRVWSLDPITFEPIDFENYYIDLAEAGTNPAPPTIKKSYSARDEYDMPDLSPASWQNLSERMENSNVLLQRFMQHYYSHTRPGFICTENCRITRLCNIRNPSFEHAWTCIDSLTTAPVVETTTTQAPETCPTFAPQPVDWCRCPAQ